MGMEYVSGIKIKDILLDNGNWWKIFIRYRHLIRISIVINVIKVLICRTPLLGFHHYICEYCNKSLKVPHSCKSKFCSSCGKKATDNWTKTAFNIFPQTIWQHITFTLPEDLWDFFWINRKLMNIVPPIAANRIINKIAKQKGFLPGIFLAIHTFGKEFKAGKLKLPPQLKHLKSYSAFNSWLNHLYHKEWVVHLNHQSDNMKNNVDYLGRYLKRPPIGETRIKSYNGKQVTYEFFDHYTETKQTLSLPVLEFIQRLIVHIPDKYFRNIRYYGFLANRIRSKLLPIVNNFLKKSSHFKNKVYVSWRNMIKNNFNRDPLKCPFCSKIMILIEIKYSESISYISTFHKEIANGFFPLL